MCTAGYCLNFSFNDCSLIKFSSIKVSRCDSEFFSWLLDRILITPLAIIDMATVDSDSNSNDDHYDDDEDDVCTTDDNA